MLSATVSISSKPAESLNKLIPDIAGALFELGHVECGPRADRENDSGVDKDGITRDRHIRNPQANARAQEGERRARVTSLKACCRAAEARMGCDFPDIKANQSAAAARAESDQVGAYPEFLK